MNLFELKTVVINGDRRRDGSCKTFEQSMGVFSTRRKAERFMRGRMVEERYFERIFAFFIYRKELDGGLLHPRNIIGEFLEVWSYLGDGSLYCHCACDDAGEQAFHGRAARTIRLGKGDLAWYMGHDRIVPCMVSYQPMTDVEYRKRARKLGHDLGLGYMDDSYVVYMYGNNHEHPPTWRLFPFFGSLSKHNLKRLLETKKWYDDLDAKALQNERKS